MSTVPYTERSVMVRIPMMISLVVMVVWSCDIDIVVDFNSWLTVALVVGVITLHSSLLQFPIHHQWISNDYDSQRDRRCLSSLEFCNGWLRV